MLGCRRRDAARRELPPGTSATSRVESVKRGRCASASAPSTRPFWAPERRAFIRGKKFSTLRVIIAYPSSLLWYPLRDLYCRPPSGWKSAQEPDIDRPSRPGLRVNASLDVDTVLHQIAESARARPAPATASSSPSTRHALSRTPSPPASRPTKGGRSRGGPTTCGRRG